MSDNPELDRGFFYQQFPNLDKHHDSTNNPNPEWYELIDENGNIRRDKFASGGKIKIVPDVEDVKLSDHFK